MNNGYFASLHCFTLSFYTYKVNANAQLEVNANDVKCEIKFFHMSKKYQLNQNSPVMLEMQAEEQVCLILWL